MPPQFKLTGKIAFGVVLFLAILVGCSSFANLQRVPSGKSNSFVLVNGEVWTPNGWKEALIVEDGVITAVGTNAEINASLTEGLRIRDLEGKSVFPGIHEMHVHGLYAGLESLACSFPHGSEPEVIRETVLECVQAAEVGEWVVGGNWVAAVFEEGEQNKEFLDAIAPDNPVILGDESHHSAWVNSRALEIAGITRDSLDPEGGIIERDEHGEPNGMLRETATYLVENILPPPSEKLRQKALTYATREMLSFGITSFIDASVRERDYSIYAKLAAEGQIKQRVRGCIVWEKSGKEWTRAGFQTSEGMIKERAKYSQTNLSFDCIKLILDGVPTESRTASMVRPYFKDGKPLDADDPRNYGFLMIPQPILNKAVADFDRQGFRIKFHAAGDGAARAALDAVEYARDINGWGGPVHHVGHSTFVTKEDIPRASRLNVAWEFSPYIWYPTPMASVDIKRVVGDELMKRWMPIRDAVEAGTLVAAGSDWSIVPSVNPWLAIETMVTREKPGGSEETLGVGQRVSREDAMKIMTENGAALMGHRNMVGTIEVGMKADIIVTEQNPMTVPIYDVHKTKVLQTFINGELVYQAASDEIR